MSVEVSNPVTTNVRHEIEFLNGHAWLNAPMPQGAAVNPGKPTEEEVFAQAKKWKSQGWAVRVVRVTTEREILGEPKE